VLDRVYSIKAAKSNLPPDWQPDAVRAFQLPGEPVVFTQNLPQTFPIVILHSEERFDGLQHAH
jgi:hypothetical protein